MRRKKAEPDSEPVSAEEIADAMTMLRGEPILQFQPPAPQIIRAADGKLSAEQGGGWIKLAFEFRKSLKDFRGSRLHIFLDICLHINESGWAWPNLKTICRETGYSRDTVMSEIEYLAKNTGVLEVTRSRGKVNRYRPSYAAYGQSGKFRPVGAIPTTSEQPVGATPTTTSGSHSDSKKNHKKKNHKEKEPVGAGKPRPRDELFDTICEVCKVDTSIKGNGSSVGTVKNALLSADPPYTPADVRRYAHLTWHKPPTIWQLKQEIGIVRNGNGKSYPPPTVTTRDDLSPEEQIKYDAWVAEYESQRKTQDA